MRNTDVPPELKSAEYEDECKPKYEQPNRQGVSLVKLKWLEFIHVYTLDVIVTGRCAAICLNDSDKK